MGKKNGFKFLFCLLVQEWLALEIPLFKMGQKKITSNMLNGVMFWFMFGNCDF